MSLTNFLTTGNFSFNGILGLDFRNHFGANLWTTGTPLFTSFPFAGQVQVKTQGPPREENLDGYVIEEEEEEWGVTPSER